MNLDAIIFGGGAAGLWLLDSLVRARFSALLVERDALGAGQTVASQGIIHGGMKYAITGDQKSAAQAIRDMPALWRECLAGRGTPDLRRTHIKSDCCYMWRTSSLASTLGMIGARVGLRSQADKVAPPDRPEALRQCPGDVFRLDEQVLDAATLLDALAGDHRSRCLRMDAVESIEFQWSQPGCVQSVRLTNPANGEVMTVQPRHVVFTAGAGNAELRQRAGLPGETMQRRPLHMVLARGALPPLFGHCIDGARTRVTVTSATDSEGRTVWQIGGQVSEDGVRMNELELIVHARRELFDVLPGLSLTGVEWTTYRIDRAEGVTADGGRPADVQIRVEGNVVTVWPTKLALAPRAAMLVVERLGSPATCEPVDTRALAHWPHPVTASFPWETLRTWVKA